jgi:hypothetical protein
VLLVDGPAQQAVQSRGVLLRMLPKSAKRMETVQYLFACQDASHELHTWCVAAAAGMGLLGHRRTGHIWAMVAGLSDEEVQLLPILFNLGVQQPATLLQLPQPQPQVQQQGQDGQAQSTATHSSVSLVVRRWVGKFNLGGWYQGG